jgi:tRNA threonylcarbamoyladenosine biosynthesis protein TsaB
MRILAIDTSTWWGSLALVERPEPGGVIAELGMQVGQTHAAVLLAGIERLLEIAGWARTSLDGYVATRGPGSFTGLRVGLGTVTGLGLANDRPAVGINTLDAIAEAHGPSVADRLVLLGAGRGEMFGARFDPAGSPPLAIEGPWVEPPPTVLSRAQAGPPAIAIPAPGTESLLEQAGFREAGIPIGAPPRSVAAAAGRLALATGVFEDGAEESLSPLYLRPPDAVLKSSPR